MKYTDKLLEDEEFRSILEQIRELEVDRIYCCHGLEHLLDVSRIAWIKRLEDSLTDGNLDDPEAEKDKIYLTGLLHDIGRAHQARHGGDHGQAGAEIASRILRRIDAPKDWTEEIVQLIKNHKGRSHKGALTPFEEAILLADHLCRNCFVCKAYDTCKWKDSEKNKGIRY